MSKKGGKATPRGQLDKAENRTTPTNEFIPGIPDPEWELLQEIEEVTNIIYSQKFSSDGCPFITSSERVVGVC